MKAVKEKPILFTDEEREKLSLEESLSLLDEICRRMEEEKPLEELMTLYEQGKALEAHAEKLLQAAEKKLEVLSESQYAETE